MPSRLGACAPPWNAVPAAAKEVYTRVNPCVRTSIPVRGGSRGPGGGAIARRAAGWLQRSSAATGRSEAELLLELLDRGLQQF